jgi:hypothetical protein
MRHVRFTAAMASLLTAAAFVAYPAVSSASPTSAASPAPLTNLAHLDFLTDTVTPPAQPGHTTYRLGSEPGVGVLWVYANHLPDGGYQRTGGGPYDPAANRYGQGSYDADDISRAAIVYLRHWLRSGDRHSQHEAYQLLRGLTYLQTASGPNAGNVVLWMQPDGTLNPSPTPREEPDPSDSGASYWLARAVWALGEGYAAFRDTDPAFAAFLRERMELAVGALDRQVLTRYGQYQVVDGARVPAWLVVDGADATSEAVLGLSAYVRVTGSRPARTALAELATGIAAMGDGGTGVWPYGAILPWALSRSLWHAWGAQMPTALANAATVLHEPRLLRPAVADTASFTPRLLTATGPINGWLPTPIDGSQIAYGADARVQSLLAVSVAAHAIGLRLAAGVAAGWFFGQNPAGVAMYNPSTGATNDGVAADGTVNLNSGAESTIHGLLSMEVLDANPDVALIARASATVVHRDAQRTIEAEAGQLSGPASVVAADPAWTGESQWSGGAYVQLTPGSQLSWRLPSTAQPFLVEAVINRVPGPGGVTTFSTPAGPLGVIRYGGGGSQGRSAAPGALLPIAIPRYAPAGSEALTTRTDRGSGQLDALLVTPLVSNLTARGDGHGIAVLTSVADTDRSLRISVPGSGPTVARSFDTYGKLVRVIISTGPVTVIVPAGGFAIAQR